MGAIVERLSATKGAIVERLSPETDVTQERNNKHMPATDQMTTHALARQLLAAPDVAVAVHDQDGGIIVVTGIETAQADAAGDLYVALALER